MNSESAARVAKLNNLSSSEKAVLAVINEIRLSSQVLTFESGAQVNLGRIPNAFKSGWHMFVPVEYLAFLDKNSVRVCAKTYEANQEWAN